MFEEHYPNRLNFLRRQLSLSQKRAAHLLGYRDRTMISKYERGHLLPTFMAAMKFQILYDTAIAEIFPNLFAELRKEFESRQTNRHNIP